MTEFFHKNSVYFLCFLPPPQNSNANKLPGILTRPTRGQGFSANIFTRICDSCHSRGGRARDDKSVSRGKTNTESVNRGDFLLDINCECGL